MTAEKMVEMVAAPGQTVVLKPAADKPEESHVGGPDAKPFKVTATEAERLEKLGAAKRSDEVEEAPAPRKVARKELEARAAEVGISVSELKGTGPKGAATDAELSAAIAAKEAAAGTGGGGTAGNPSIVD